MQPNFWIVTETTSGTRKSVSTRNNDGGFKTRIEAKRKGRLTQALTVVGTVQDGHVEIKVCDADGKVVHTFQTVA